MAFVLKITWKDTTSLDLKEAGDDGFCGWHWHQLDHMQSIEGRFYRLKLITTP